MGASIGSWVGGIVTDHLLSIADKGLRRFQAELFHGLPSGHPMARHSCPMRRGTIGAAYLDNEDYVDLDLGVRLNDGSTDLGMGLGGTNTENYQPAASDPGGAEPVDLWGVDSLIIESVSPTYEFVDEPPIHDFIVEPEPIQTPWLNNNSADFNDFDFEFWGQMHILRPRFGFVPHGPSTRGGCLHRHRRNTDVIPT